MGSPFPISPDINSLLCFSRYYSIGFAIIILKIEYAICSLFSQYIYIYINLYIYNRYV